MGVGGISIWQLLIVLVLVILVFGSGKLRSLGADLGASLKGFRQAMKDGEDETLKPDPPEALDESQKTAESSASRHDERA